MLAAVSGAGITQPAGTIYRGKVHVTDWLPSLVSMASGRDWHDFIPADEPPYQLGDGMDVWEGISSGTASPRDWLLLETHPEGAHDRVHGDALIVGDWKLLRWNNTMPPEEDGWFPPPGQDPATVSYRVDCGGTPPGSANPKECNDDWCLFNVTADPCEIHDVAKQHPDVVRQLRARLATFSATAVAPVAPNGCNPVIVTLPDGAKAWQPCDAPSAAPVQLGSIGAPQRVLWRA